MNEQQARKELIEVCRQAYGRGYICATEGNFSVRLGPDLVLSTPSGVCKGRIDVDDLILTDLTGCPVDSAKGTAQGKRRPSTELGMHMMSYKARPDVNAVVHAHPTVAVSFTVAGLKLSQCILPEVVCALGSIPIAPYATPSTQDVADGIRELVKDHDALVLDHHGALTLGVDIWDAFYKLETLEHHAQILLVAHILGGVKELSAQQIQKLLEIRKIYGFTRPLKIESEANCGGVGSKSEADA
ncbi:MAG: class II aldolase/adducin family protein [Candidatus Melainabacteria bacterium]|nr:class II aldolase/adducin family protein [Candidatus Melainabacteria bacterium]